MLETSVNMTENDIDVKVGKRIELRRKELKMTQKDLSKKIGVTATKLGTSSAVCIGAYAFAMNQ